MLVTISGRPERTRPTFLPTVNSGVLVGRMRYFICQAALTFRKNGRQKKEQVVWVAKAGYPLKKKWVKASCELGAVPRRGQFSSGGEAPRCIISPFLSCSGPGERLRTKRR